MEIEKKYKYLQVIYAGALADAVYMMGKEGILDKVTQEKRNMQLTAGKAQVAQLGISSPKEVFEVLSDIFQCANWQVTEENTGCRAEASHCVLCSMAKKLGAESPCRIYCLNPMEGMVKGIRENAEFTVQDTLWTGSKCSVEVTY